MIEIFVITTPGDHIRAQHLQQQLSMQIGIEQFKITQWPATMDYGTPAIGISKSHRSIVQKAKEEGAPEVIIMEDDIKFVCPNALVRFLNLNLVIPKDTDLLFAGIYDGDLHKEASIYSKIRGRLSGLHLYVVKQKFYDEFLSVDPVFNLDYAISETRNPVMYCADPFLAYQIDGIYSYNRKGEGAHNYGLTEKYKLAECE